MGLRPLRHALAVAAALFAVGCGTAFNYLEPEGPGFTGGFTAGPRPPAGRRVVRVVSYNIEHAERVAEAIENLQEQEPLRDADLLLLQEMDLPGTEAVAKALGLNYAFYPASRGPGNGKDMGEAVLSPWPIEAHWKVPLPHLTALIHRSRAAVGARVLVAGRPLVAYSVHLGSPWGMGATRRREQAQVVLADAQKQTVPVVIGGDFNSRGVSERVYVPAGYLWPTRDVGGTAGPFSFDHVVGRGFVPAALPASGAVRGAKNASDHRPVWARFALP